MAAIDNSAKAPETEPAGDAAAAPARRWRLPSGKLRIVIPAAVVATAAIAAATFFVGRNGGDEPTPHERFLLALELIDRRGDIDAQTAAAEIADSLQTAGYRDPDFAGGTEFILGIASFRSAQGMDETQSERRYLKAAVALRNAEQRALEASRRPEWAYALGTSLHAIGRATDARPLLEEAVETYPPGRVEASIGLVDIYLDLKTEDVLLRAVPLLQGVTSTPDLNREQYDGAWLRSAQVYLALNRQAEAEQSLARVSDDTQGNQATIVFRAQTLMAEAESTMLEAQALSKRAKSLAAQAQQAVEQNLAVEAGRLNAQADAVSEQALSQHTRAEGRYREAIGQLEIVANDVGLEQTFVRQASYLLGVCAAAVDDNDAAIVYFERTADKHPRSHEGLAANLRAADLLRRAGRNEEAINKRYAAALRTVRRPEDFRNRWLSLEQFRRHVRAAWEEWTAAHDYREAIALAGMMTPLFLEAVARELQARANQQWAEHLGLQARRAAYSHRGRLLKEQREQWRQSGKAHAALAAVLQASAEYPNALRISAEHYALGHDFDNSLRQWNQFIATRPQARLAEALVNRARVLMDLDRLDEALAELEMVIEDFPTDSAAFEAQYQLGLCRLERNELEEAEKVWRGIITSDELTPAARQWQLALLSLGRLQYHSAAMKKIAAESPGSQLASPAAAALLDESFVRWNDAIRHLGLFLAFVGRDARHPEAVEAQPEARFLLAKALRHSAQQPQQKLESAETENARLELRRTMQELLGQARDEYRTLQSELLALEEIDMLGEFERRLLRDCFYELAHTYYALAGYGIDSAEDNYNKAIVAYSSAANKYSRDPQVILAYLQISNCYERLGKPSDARSSLEQAKVVLKQLSDETFAAGATNLTKQEWQAWLEWIQTLQRGTDTKTAQQ